MRRALAPIILLALLTACGATEESETAVNCVNDTKGLCPPGTAPNVSAEATSSCDGESSVDILTESGEIAGTCRSDGTCTVACEVTQPCACGVLEITDERVLCAECNPEE